MFGKVRKLGMKNEGGFWEKGNRVAGPCTAIQMKPRAVGKLKNPRGEGASSNPRSFEEEVFPYIQSNGGIAPLAHPFPTALQPMAGL